MKVFILWSFHISWWWWSNSFSAVWKICIKSAQRRWVIMLAACTTIQMNLTCVAKSSKHSSRSVLWNETMQRVVEIIRITAHMEWGNAFVFRKIIDLFCLYDSVGIFVIDNVRPLNFCREMLATSTIQNSSNIITDNNIFVLERGCNLVSTFKMHISDALVIGIVWFWSIRFHLC